MCLSGLVVLAAGCASAPPEQQADLCEVFEQYPDWYDYARDSVKQWGTPVHVLMAFVRHESSYRAKAKPPFKWFLFIPLGRASSAKGYAQAQDPVWGEYQAERGRLFRSRSDMEDALDFIGWYNYKSWRELGIDRADAYRLYLAYHEGRGGYRRGTWKEQARGAALRETGRRDRALPTSPSSHAAKSASAATPGTRSGRSAVEARRRDSHHRPVAFEDEIDHGDSAGSWPAAIPAA